MSARTSPTSQRFWLTGLRMGDIKYYFCQVCGSKRYKSQEHLAGKFMLYRGKKALFRNKEGDAVLAICPDCTARIALLCKRAKQVEALKKETQRSQSSHSRSRLISDEDWLLSETEAAILLDRAKDSLRRERCRNRGVPYVKMGRSVRYRYLDLKAYIDSCLVDTTKKK